MWAEARVSRPEFCEDYCFFFFIPQCFASILGIWSVVLNWLVTFCPHAFVCCEVKLRGVHPEFKWERSPCTGLLRPTMISFPGSSILIYSPLCSYFFCHAGLLKICLPGMLESLSKIASSPPLKSLCKGESQLYFLWLSCLKVQTLSHYTHFSSPSLRCFYVSTSAQF